MTLNFAPSSWRLRGFDGELFWRKAATSRSVILRYSMDLPVTRMLDEIVEEPLRELSDEQAQARLWTSSGGPEVSSLAEVKSRLLDDSGLADEMERGIVYSVSIDVQLRRLHDTLRRINENAPVAEVLASQDLATVRVLATGLLEELRKFGYDRADP